MKCKMFLIDRLEEAENEVNKWLEEKPYINIDHVELGQYNSKYSILMVIFYFDRKDKLLNLDLNNESQ